MSDKREHDKCIGNVCTKLKRIEKIRGCNLEGNH